jgi:hypothetical protein
MIHIKNAAIPLVASFLVALVVTSGASSSGINAYATGGGHDDYDDDYIKKVIKKWLFNHLNDYDRDEIKEKLKKLIEFEVECDQDQHTNLPLDTLVTCEASAELKDHVIFDKYPILKKILINILVNDLHITVTDPSGEVAYEEDIEKWWDNKEYDSDSDYGEKSREFSFVVDQPGQWILEVEFTKFGHVIKTFDCSFYVLPESPVGALAMVGSSLAAMGGFLGLRKFRHN